MPTDFVSKSAADQKATPAATPQFHAKVAQLPPGHPARTKAIDKLVTRSFTASPKQLPRIAQALKSLNPSPDEVAYIRQSSGTRGEAAAAAQEHASREQAIHHDIPAIAHVADLAATGGLVGDIKHGRAESAGIDAAFLLPMLRPLRAVRAAATAGRAVRAGEGVTEAARAGRAAYAPRTVKLGEQATQFPLSPSHVTAWAQKHLDRLSERLVAPATRLNESDNLAARAAGKVVTKASAQARVPIQAGKHLKQEARRATSLRAPEVKTLSPSLLHGDEGSQLAHFWWAQLPAAHRTVEGLQLIRNKLALERSDQASRIAGLSGHAPGTRNTPQLRRAVEDLRSSDKNLAKLDKVIAKPPALQPHVIDAARTLMSDREAALVAAGKLHPGTAATRAGLVSKWLGLQPTGEEVYMGHRLAEQRHGILPGGGGLGGTRVPAGVGHENRMVLASTGKVRQSMHTAVEDWQRAQSYAFTTHAKNELAQMGERIGPEGPKPGHLVVNPQGHTLPRTWKLDEEQRAAAEGLKPEDVHLNDLEEYARNTLAAGADRTRLIAAAAQAGHAADLRQVPADVARRYFAQFVPHRVVAGTVPGVVRSTKLWTKGADLAHDLTYASLIYSNPGYIPANTVANLVMAGLHQGAFLPVNLIRAGQAFFGSGPRLRALLNAEVGMGATRALGSEGQNLISRGLQGVSGKIAGIPDNIPRTSAFIHEAARMGVISKVSPILSKADQRALEDLLTNPAKRPLLNDIRDRAVQAMVDFERLGAHEKATAKRLFFVWAWTRGATRYPLRFALDHPLRSVALGYAAAGAPGAPSDVQQRVREVTPTFAHGMPSWLRQAINAGHTSIGGKRFPRILPTQSISPISTPWQVASTLKDVASGNTAKTQQQLLDYANPLIPSAVKVASKQTEFGQRTSYLGALEGQAQRLSPVSGLVRGEVTPKAGGIYPGDATRLGRFERALRVFPVAVDSAQAYKARLREGSVPQGEQDQHRRAADQTALETQMHELGDVPPAWQKAARVAQHAKSERDIALAAAQRALPKGKRLAAINRYEITLKVMHDQKMLGDAQYQAGLANSKKMTDEQLDYWRARLWRTTGFGDAGGPGAILSTIHHAHNELPAVKNKRTTAP